MDNNESEYRESERWLMYVLAVPLILLAMRGACVAWDWLRRTA